jgi:hypothetical protein
MAGAAIAPFNWVLVVENFEPGQLLALAIE